MHTTRDTVRDHPTSPHLTTSVKHTYTCQTTASTEVNSGREILTYISSTQSSCLNPSPAFTYLGSAGGVSSKVCIWRSLPDCRARLRTVEVLKRRAVLIVTRCFLRKFFLGGRLVYDNLHLQAPLPLPLLLLGFPPSFLQQAPQPWQPPCRLLAAFGVNFREQRRQHVRSCRRSKSKLPTFVFPASAEDE
jgi:hypothetical protein